MTSSQCRTQAGPIDLTYAVAVPLRTIDEGDPMRCVECHAQTARVPCAACGKEPRVAGRYSLLERVGGGSSGVVFRGMDSTTGDEVAIKEVMLGGLDSDKTRELALREARILRQLKHPAIPAWRDERTLGIGRSAALYLVQDFVSGADLQEGLASHRWSEREVLGVMVEVLKILEYLHGLHPSVVHRDIKPANLIRRDDGSLALVDFGAVRDVLRHASHGGHTVAGTFGYMAPEQFAGHAEPRSDLYALGMTAVALLSRELPASLHDRLGHLDWERVVSVSPGTTALLRGLLQADPEARPPSAAAVRRRIEGMLAEASPLMSEGSAVEAPILSLTPEASLAPSTEARGCRRARGAMSAPLVHEPLPVLEPLQDVIAAVRPEAGIPDLELDDHTIIRAEDVPHIGLEQLSPYGLASSTLRQLALLLAGIGSVFLILFFVTALTAMLGSTAEPSSLDASAEPAVERGGARFVPAQTATSELEGTPASVQITHSSCIHSGEDTASATYTSPQLVQLDYSAEHFVRTGRPHYPDEAREHGEVLCQLQMFFAPDGTIVASRTAAEGCPVAFQRSLCSGSFGFQRVPDPQGRPVEVKMPVRFKPMVSR